MRAELTLGTRHRLEAAEAHHLINVLRRRSGDAVEAIDATGQRFDARLVDSRGTIETVARLTQPARVLDIVLLVGLVKGARIDWLVEKVSELGARRLQPVSTARSLLKPGPARLERWQRLAIAAAKQCGREQPLLVDPPCLLQDVDPNTLPAPRMTLEIGGDDLSGRLNGASSATLAIGPEGGFAVEDRTWLADTGFAPIELGLSTLRTETAVLAALTLTAYNLRRNAG